MENTEKVVYLDNAATTACAPEALAVMVEALNGACGNPSSHYSVGYEAKEFVDKGRAQVAKAINASTSEIFFTGCGSEADNWAVKGLGHHCQHLRGTGSRGSIVEINHFLHSFHGIDPFWQTTNRFCISGPNVRAYDTF